MPGSSERTRDATVIAPPATPLSAPPRQVSPPVWVVDLASGRIVALRQPGATWAWPDA